jgi:hypothetical protein
LTRLPVPIHDVVLLPGWPVILLPSCPSSRYIDRARFDRGGSLKWTGSESTNSPGPMVVDAEPSNVRRFVVDPSISPTPAFPLSGRASDAAVMGKGVLPKTLEIRIRMRSARMEVRRVWRIVLFRNWYGTSSPPYLILESRRLIWNAHNRILTNGGGARLPISTS